MQRKQQVVYFKDFGAYCFFMNGYVVFIKRKQILHFFKLCIALEGNYTSANFIRNSITCCTTDIAYHSPFRALRVILPIDIPFHSLFNILITKNFIISLNKLTLCPKV